MEFLELILRDEISVREQRRITRRTVAAEFTALKRASRTSTGALTRPSRKDIYDLAACHFIRKATDVLFVGPPGAGKIHLAQAIGYLLIIDDMGLKQLPKHAGEYLLEVVMRRYETRSTIMTSNRPLKPGATCARTFPPPAPSSTASSTTP